MAEKRSPKLPEDLMKAILYRKYGSPEVLHIEQITKPEPEDDEVLIRVHAAEATKADCELRRSKFPVKWFWLPLRIFMGITKPKNRVLGGYFAGEIESVGKAVSKFKKGDRVFGAAKLRMGAYAEYMTLPHSFTIAPMPDNLTFPEAAAVPLGGFNALHFMRRAQIEAGEKVLIIGAGGSIGIFALQIAKTMGAEVTAVDSGIKEMMLRDLGADQFIDYTREDFSEGEQKYDVIFDMVARSDYTACLKMLRPKGRYSIGNPRLSDMLRSVFTTRFTDKNVMFAFAGESEEELLTLKSMVEKNAIKPVIDRVYPMEQAVEAHKRVESELRIGMVVIAMA